MDGTWNRCHGASGAITPGFAMDSLLVRSIGRDASGHHCLSGDVGDSWRARLIGAPPS